MPAVGQPSHTRRYRLVWLCLLAAAVVLLLLRHSRGPLEAHGEGARASVAGTATTSPPPPAPATGRPVPSAPARHGADDESEDGAPEDHFGVTPAGQLRLDERTRLGIEALVGIYTPSEQLHRLEQQQATLPAPAYATLVDLIARYRNYLTISRQLYPPQTPRTDAGDALRELDDLHGLRIRFFGAEVASAFYDKDEQFARTLLEKMRQDPTPGLTLQEKAERAQGAFRPR